MIDWKPVSEPPAQDCAVLLYYGGWTWSRLGSDEPVDIGPLREVCDRVHSGYYQAGEFRESGTGHDACEDENPDHHPTHWALLTAPEPGPQR